MAEEELSVCERSSMLSQVLTARHHHSTASKIHNKLSNSDVRYLQYLGKYHDAKHDNTSITKVDCAITVPQKYRKYREITTICSLNHSTVGNVRLHAEMRKSGHSKANFCI